MDIDFDMLVTFATRAIFSAAVLEPQERIGLSDDLKSSDTRNFVEFQGVFSLKDHYFGHHQVNVVISILHTMVNQLHYYN